MKQYLWILHIVAGCLAIIMSILRREVDFDFFKTAIILISLSLVALISLVSIYITENR